MTTMFGPRRCSLCGKDHYRGSCCPDASRQDREPRVYVAKPSGRIISEAAEAAFQVWERASRWVWKSERERQGAIAAFSAGWIAGEDAGSDTTDRQQEPRDTDESSLARVVEALRPFAVAIPNEVPDDAVATLRWPDYASRSNYTLGGVSWTAAQVRKAAEALSLLSPEGGGKGSSSSDTQRREGPTASLPPTPLSAGGEG
jgi:hypothetical protein